MCELANISLTARILREWWWWTDPYTLVFKHECEENTTHVKTSCWKLCQNVYFSKVTLSKYDAKATKSINKRHCSIYEKHWSSLLYIHTYIHHTNTTTTQGQLVKMTSEEQFLAQRSRFLLPKVKKWCFSTGIQVSVSCCWTVPSFCPPGESTNAIVLIPQGQNHPSE